MPVLPAHFPKLLKSTCQNVDKTNCLNPHQHFQTSLTSWQTPINPPMKATSPAEAILAAELWPQQALQKPQEKVPILIL